jgi:hypothetical protein
MAADLELLSTIVYAAQGPISEGLKKWIAHVADSIRELREKAGMSTEALAKAADLPPVARLAARRGKAWLQGQSAAALAFR